MAARVASRRLFSTTVRRFQEHEKQELKKETKRNPELMVRHNQPETANQHSSLSSHTNVRAIVH